jgi:hypothetical protein
MVDVNPDDNQKRTTENKKTSTGDRDSKTENNGSGQHGHEHLDDRILAGYRIMTMAASAAENNVTEKWNIFKPG